MDTRLQSHWRVGKLGVPEKGRRGLRGVVTDHELRYQSHIASHPPYATLLRFYLGPCKFPFPSITKRGRNMHINTNSLELECVSTGAFLRLGRREYFLSRDTRNAPAPLLERVTDGPQGGRVYFGPWCLVHEVVR